MTRKPSGSADAIVVRLYHATAQGLYMPLKHALALDNRAERCTPTWHASLVLQQGGHAAGMAPRGCDVQRRGAARQLRAVRPGQRDSIRGRACSQELPHRRGAALERCQMQRSHARACGRDQGFALSTALP